MSRSDRPPSFQFYPADWLADPVVDAMTFDQQGRYLRALCMTWQTDSPGIAQEDQWRIWMRYSPTEWQAVRGVFAPAFSMKQSGEWFQKRCIEERAAQLERRKKAQKGASATNAFRWGSVATRLPSDRSTVSLSSSSSLTTKSLRSTRMKQTGNLDFGEHAPPEIARQAMQEIRHALGADSSQEPSSIAQGAVSDPDATTDSDPPEKVP